MRQTDYRRRVRAAQDDIAAEVQRAAQAELGRLFRQVQLKIRRVNQYRPRASVRRPKLRKAYVVSNDMWEMFRRRMHSAVMRALVLGSLTLADLHRQYYWSDKVIEFNMEDFARLIEKEVGENIVRVTTSIKREVGQRVVAWYNSPGATMQSLVNQLRGRFGVERAALIAQNEVTNLNSRVVEQVAAVVGAGEWWWSSRRDQIVCKRTLTGPDGRKYAGCRELHGKVFKVGQPMPPAGSHIGCRCTPVLIAPKIAQAQAPVSTIEEQLRIRKAEFDESEHPRADDGKWTSGAGGGGKVSKKPLRPREQKFVADFPTLYHLTSPQNVDSIKRTGIKQSKRGMSGRGAYLATSPEKTQYHEDLKHGKLFRVDTKALIEKYGMFHYKDNPEGKIEYDEYEGEVIVRGDIPPEFLIPDEPPNLSAPAAPPPTKSLQSVHRVAGGKPIPGAEPASWDAERGGTLYHGTDAPDDAEYLEGEFVYLTNDFDEATGYAEGRHGRAQAGKEGGGTPRVLEVGLTPGKMVNVQDEIDNALVHENEEIEDVLRRAKSNGADYAYYEHPSFVGDGEQQVIVALNPDGQLGNIVYGYDVAEQKRWKRRFFKADFEENEHPRDGDGKFTDKGTGSAGGGKGKELSRQDLSAGVEPDGSSGRDFAREVGRRLSEKWSASDEAIAGLLAEEKMTPPAGKEKDWLLSRWLTDWTGSSGGLPSRVMISGAMEAAGIDSEGLVGRDAKDYFDKHPEQREALQSAGKLMYEETQNWFKERGIESVHLYRKGFGDDKTRPFTSWSTEYGGFITTELGREAVEADIPVSRILSVPATGFGNIAESEVVVMRAPVEKAKPDINYDDDPNNFITRFPDAKKEFESAGDANELKRIKAAYLKASDSGEGNVPDGAWRYFHKKVSEHLKSRIDQPGNAKDARVDRILRIRDSEGKARARKVDESVDLAKWEETKHPRKKDGKFAPKGQGESGGGQGPAQRTRPAQVKVSRADSTPAFGMPNPDVDNLPEVKKFRGVYYARQCFEVQQFAEYAGIRGSEFDDLHRAYTAATEHGTSPQEAFRDFMRAAKLIMKGKVDPGDLTRLEARIRVGDWRFLQGLDKKPGGGPKPEPKPEPKPPKPQPKQPDVRPLSSDTLLREQAAANQFLYRSKERQAFRNRKAAYEFARDNTMPYGKTSIKKYVDDYITAGFRPADPDRPYTLISPDGKNEKEMGEGWGKTKKAFVHNYLDAVMNRGDFARLYEFKDEDAKPAKPAGAAGADVAKKIVSMYEKGAIESDPEYQKLASAVDKADARLRNLHRDDAEYGEANREYLNAYGLMTTRRRELKAVREAEVAKLLKADKPANFKVAGYAGISDARLKERIKVGVEQVKSVLSARVKLKVDQINFIESDERSNFNQWANLITVQPSDERDIVVPHELGHWIEANNRGARHAIREFFVRRTKGEREVRLKDLKGHRHYDDDEICKPDKFIDPYAGKVYRDGSTELLSMGIQEYILHPDTFASRDPEHFALIYDILHGAYE